MLRILAASLSISLLAPSPAAAGEITLRSLVRELADLARLARFPSPSYSVRQASSYDRASRTAADAEGWFANNDRGQYIRVEDRGGRKEYVMLDERGPGAVVRIWSANPEGVLRIYIDGGEVPALEAPMADLLRGRVKPFVPPLAYEAARGCNIYFPFPYRKSCKVTSDRGDFYYHVNYRAYPEGTELEPFSERGLRAIQDEIDRAAAILSDPAKAWEPGSGHRRSDIRLEAKGTETAEATIEAPAGGGAIRRLVLRPSTRDDEVLRRTLIVLRFDGVETARAPLGDFFGSAPGINPYRSLPLSVSADGALACRWPMPFRERAVIAIQGTGAGEIRVEGAADVEPFAWNDDSLHFHARWRAEHDMKTSPPRDWNYVDLKGKGIYAGNVLNVANPVRAWWGEGDEKIYVDGEKFPSHFGTGTEDYYGYAWCCPDPFAGAYHNQTRCDGPGNFGYTSVNRWHIIDAIPFAESFRFDMEVWHWDRNIEVSYDAMNYWYARPGCRDNVPEIRPEALRIPALPERKVKRIAGAIEAEGLKAAVTAGTAGPQDMSGFADGLWSRDSHLWWQGAKPGDRLTLKFAAPKAGRYRVFVYLTKSYDYGIHRLAVNGKPAGEPIDLWSPRVIAAEPMDLGLFDLKADGNELEAAIAGTNDRAQPKNYMFGLDCLVLESE